MTRARTAVLALAPVYRGFGFVVFDHDERLLDWGYAEARKDKAAVCLARVRAILVRVSPEAVVLENINVPSCRRRQRMRDLIIDLASLAEELGFKVAFCTRDSVTRCLQISRNATKDAIAAAVANKLPAIAHRLPVPRRIWESEKTSMAMFTAAGFALAHLSRARL